MKKLFFTVTGMFVILGLQTPTHAALIVGQACSVDAQVCPDGTFVYRDPNNNCEFFPCPSASLWKISAGNDVTVALPNDAHPVNYSFTYGTSDPLDGEEMNPQNTWPIVNSIWETVSAPPDANPQIDTDPSSGEVTFRNLTIVGTYTFRYKVSEIKSSVEAYDDMQVKVEAPDLATFELFILGPKKIIRSGGLIEGTTYTMSTDSGGTCSSLDELALYIEDSWAGDGTYTCGGGYDIILDWKGVQHLTKLFSHPRDVLERLYAFGKDIKQKIVGKLALATSGSLITISAPDGIGKGDTVQLFAKIWNLGTLAAGSDFNNQFSYQFDSTSDAGWRPIDPTLTRAAVPPPGKAVDRVAFTIPYRPGGMLYIRHCLDINNQVHESDESNCTISTGISVGPTPIYSCTSPVLNGSLYDTEESSDLQADTPWRYSASDTNTKCEYSCDATYFPLNNTCVRPNLTSNTEPTISDPNPTEGEIVTFEGTVRNSGLIDINTPFTDNFSYQWNRGGWNVLSLPISHSSMQIDTTSSDTSDYFSLNYSGELQIMHCIDSAPSQITESDETMGDNCKIGTFQIAPRPTGNITADPELVLPGETSLISWDTNGADTCTTTNNRTADEWTQLSNPLGTISPALTSDTTFVLTCNNINIDSVLVRVTPEVIITSSSRIVKQGATTLIGWNTNGNPKASCSLSGAGLTSDDLNDTGVGSKEVTVMGKATYTLRCDTKEASVSVQVIPTMWSN